MNPLHINSELQSEIIERLIKRKKNTNTKTDPLENVQIQMPLLITSRDLCIQILMHAGEIECDNSIGQNLIKKLFQFIFIQIVFDPSKNNNRKVRYENWCWLVCCLCLIGLKRFYWILWFSSISICR